MNIDTSKLFRWGIFGGTVGFVNFFFVLLLSKILSLDVMSFAKAAVVGFYFPLDWIAKSIYHFFVFEILFWAVLTVLGAFLLQLVESRVKSEFWALFAPVVIGRFLAAIILYLNFDPMFYVVEFIAVAMLVFFASQIYNFFNRSYP